METKATLMALTGGEEVMVVEVSVAEVGVAVEEGDDVAVEEEGEGVVEEDMVLMMIMKILTVVMLRNQKRKCL